MPSARPGFTGARKMLHIPSSLWNYGSGTSSAGAGAAWCRILGGFPSLQSHQPELREAFGSGCGVLASLTLLGKLPWASGGWGCHNGNFLCPCVEEFRGCHDGNFLCLFVEFWGCHDGVGQQFFVSVYGRVLGLPQREFFVSMCGVLGLPQ